MVVSSCDCTGRIQAFRQAASDELRVIFRIIYRQDKRNLWSDSCFESVSGDPAHRVIAYQAHLKDIKELLPDQNVNLMNLVADETHPLADTTLFVSGQHFGKLQMLKKLVAIEAKIANLVDQFSAKNIVTKIDIKRLRAAAVVPDDDLYQEEEDDVDSLQSEANTFNLDAKKVLFLTFSCIVAVAVLVRK